MKIEYNILYHGKHQAPTYLTNTYLFIKSMAVTEAANGHWSFGIRGRREG